MQICTSLQADNHASTPPLHTWGRQLMQIQLCCVSFSMNLSLLWFFRAAATEIGVLQDVLAVAREKRYLVLDPINSEMMEQRNLPVLLMLARKKVHFAFLLQYYKAVWLQSSSVSLLSLRFDRLLCICAVVSTVETWSSVLLNCTVYFYYAALHAWSAKMRCLATDIAWIGLSLCVCMSPLLVQP